MVDRQSTAAPGARVPKAGVAGRSLKIHRAHVLRRIAGALHNDAVQDLAQPGLGVCTQLDGRGGIPWTSSPNSRPLSRRRART